MYYDSRANPASYCQSYHSSSFFVTETWKIEHFAFAAICLLELSTGIEEMRNAVGLYQ